MFNTRSVVKALEGHKEDLQEELGKIDLALNALTGAATRNHRTVRGQALKASSRPRRVLSAEARQRIGRATRRRWAMVRKGKKTGVCPQRFLQRHTADIAPVCL
jgi:hypothetical protein